jgi:hypothetical protein
LRSKQIILLDDFIASMKLRVCMIIWDSLTNHGFILLQLSHESIVLFTESTSKPLVLTWRILIKQEVSLQRHFMICSRVHEL